MEQQLNRACFCKRTGTKISLEYNIENYTVCALIEVKLCLFLSNNYIDPYIYGLLSKCEAEKNKANIQPSRPHKLGQ